MRMTNKIMQNNSLYNINNNKVLMDKLSTMQSTQKKITRPSDDPVVAIRALRLRTNVSELTQYYSKNAPDAESWLKVTEEALGNGIKVLEDLGKQAVKGANKDLGADSLAIIIEQMKKLRDEYYSTGNEDYAGRYVFTGYRTDTPLSFTKEVESGNPSYCYKITESFKMDDFDSVNYTNMSVLEGLTKSNYDDTTKYAGVVTEQKISNADIHRIRLSYNDLDEGAMPTIVDKNGASLLGGTAIAKGTSTDDAYRQIEAANKAGASAVMFVPETGEILFSDVAYTALNTAAGSDGDVNITYTKNKWKNGDLRPEHYFKCDATVIKDGVTGDPVKHNYDADVDSQIIEYDVGYNQTIRVNTLATEAFTHDLDRDIYDLERALDTLSRIGTTMDDLENIKKNMLDTDPLYNDVVKEYEAAKKAYDYTRENIHTLFEHADTSFQKYMDKTNVAVTDNGTRSSRLDLVSNRLMDQKTTFETLQSENEDVDIAEVIIQLTSANLTYNSALMATSKIMQNTLMNYI